MDLWGYTGMAAAARYIISRHVEVPGQIVG
jgi:hypothetical protein